MYLYIFVFFIPSLCTAQSDQVVMPWEEPFIVIKENQTNYQFLKTLHASGQLYLIDIYPENSKVEVILPFVYISDLKNKKLDIYSNTGKHLFSRQDLLSFSANEYGLLVHNDKKQLEVYIIKNGKFLKCPNVLEQIEKFKISEHIIVTSKEGRKNLDSYKINMNQLNYYPLVTHGQKLSSNISSITYSNNFFVEKDWQQLISITNLMGSSITHSRGVLKSYYITSNHLIMQYGDDHVDVFNAYDDQYILTLPNVYTLKTSTLFSSFERSDDVTIVNEDGEIFSLKIKMGSQFSRGESNFAISDAENLKVYDYYGKLLFENIYPQLIEHYFVGDFICIKQKYMLEQSCINTITKYQFTVPLIQLVGLAKWGIYQFNMDSQLLEVFFNDGKNRNFLNISQIFAPKQLPQQKENILKF